MIIKADGGIVVTAPKRISLKAIERFVAAKSEWLAAALEKYRAVPARPKRDTGQEYKLYKKQAEKLIKERLEHFNASYGFRWQRISVRNQKTRWGSCSKKGNLNFSYRLALLPEKLSDYIIVHELCHLKELNHSPRFWKLVALTIPDYMQRRRELRKLDLFSGIA